MHLLKVGRLGYAAWLCVSIKLATSVPIAVPTYTAGSESHREMLCVALTGSCQFTEPAHVDICPVISISNMFYGAHFSTEQHVTEINTHLFAVRTSMLGLYLIVSCNTV